MIPDQPTDPERNVASWGSWTDEGEGPILLAIHGLPGSVRDFRYLGGALDGRFRLVRVDLPGFGEAPAGFPATASGTIAYLDRVVEELGEPVYVAGHSFGSTYAAAYAARRRDKVRGLALLAPIGRRKHRGFRSFPDPRLLRWTMNLPLVGSAMELKFVEGFERFGFKNVTVADARRTIDTLANFSFSEHISNLHELDVPTLVSWAADDRLIEPEIVQEIIDTLPEGPRLRFDEGGHNLQKHRAVELADALASWMAW